MTDQRDVYAEAVRLARALKRYGRKLVLAESCTGGLASAALAGIPGISAHLCGSAVVYRLGTKQSWLGIPGPLLKNPGPVSGPVAEEMARRVLQQTPEADLAASITGHLGPDAPSRQDGRLFIAAAWRLDGTSACRVFRHRLPAQRAGKTLAQALALRRARQREAARLVLATVRRVLEPGG